MPKRVKCPTCSSGWCMNHLFVLKPLSGDVYFRKEQKTRICPKLNKSTNFFQKSMPILHADNKFYTPCFVLQDEKKFYTDNDQRVKKNHFLKTVEEQDSEKVSIVINFMLFIQRMDLISSFHQLFQLIPKHARKKNYCAVCRDGYQDYLQHIDSLDHKKMIKGNKFNSYIIELQNLVQSQKATKVENIVQESTESEMQKLRKLVKVNENI